MLNRDGSQAERGQMLIVFILVITVMFMVGAIAVDVGLWLSEKRGSQTDADFAALAGAWELLDPAADESDAQDAAAFALVGNDEQLNASFITTPEVDMASRCVSVDVAHESRALFIQFFGIADEPDIGAHAVACAGASNAPGDVVPFHVTDNPGPCFTADEEPIYTALCPVENGAHAGSVRGLLDLWAAPYCSNNGGGANTVAEAIENGVPGLCLINEGSPCPNNSGSSYDCVRSQNGNTSQVLEGVNRRTSKDGDCDAEYGTDANTIDDFFESVELVFDTGSPYSSIYEARDCDLSTDGLQKSPRLVTIIVLEEALDSNDWGPILAFAAMFIGGCGDERDTFTDESQLDPYCGDQIVADLGGAGAISDDLYVMAGLPAPKKGHCGPGGIGHGNNPTCAPALTPTPTPTPIIPTLPPTPTLPPLPSITLPATPTLPPLTPTPSPPPVPGCPPGHCTVFARFVNLITAGGEIGGPPTGQTTLFGISLVE